MFYGQIKVGEVIAHIAGPSGSGKTTLLSKIKSKHPHFVTKDLDIFDEDAEKNLGYSDTRKNDYTDEMLSKLHNEKQRLLNNFISANHDKQIILGGHHTESGHILDMPVKTKRLMLSTSPYESARRAFKREEGMHPGNERLESEIPDDVREAKDTIKELQSLGYRKISARELLSKIHELNNRS